jgi:hypothetical protein
MLHSFAEEREGRRQRAAAAASDSLVVQSFAPVPPPLQTVGASSCPRGRSSSADRILQSFSLLSLLRFVHARQGKKPMQRLRDWCKITMIFAIPTL